MTFKFGDIVENQSAGENNPHLRSIVVRVGHNSGRLNPGKWVECTDGKGEFWRQGGPVDDYLKVVGTVLADNGGESHGR